jgi:RNA ligase
MNYEFPIITHINDVLPHIQERNEFKVIDKGDYLTITYAVAFENTFQWDSNDPIGSAVRRECRGITFDSNGNLICRKYHKFFNIGEKEETQLNKVNLYEPHIVLQKLDGSLIAPQPSSNGLVLTTKAGVTEIAQQAEEFIADKPHYSTFIKKCIQRGTTPLFEWCSNKNRIVISYETDQLILTGLRYNDTGKYVDYEVMKTYATSWNIPVVQAVNGLAVQDINLFVKQVREWDDGEGVVIRFSSGHMCKVKSADYVLRHKTKDSISQEKNVIATILDDSVDDLVPLLTPQDAERLQQFQHAFWLSVEDVCGEIYDLYKQIDKGQNQKEYATMAVASVLPQYQTFMYQLRKGVPIKDLVIEQIRKSLSNQTKIHNNRWLFGNIQW